MSKSHLLYVSFYTFRQKIDKTKWVDQKIPALLRLLAKVFALKQLLLDSAVCYETGFFGSGSSELLTESMNKSLQELRPHMVPLTEMNSTSEMNMSYLSAIGNEYGDIYET